MMDKYTSFYIDKLKALKQRKSEETKHEVMPKLVHQQRKAAKKSSRQNSNSSIEIWPFRYSMIQQTSQ